MLAEPAPQLSPSALAAAAASPFRPGEKITSPSSTLPGFAPPADMQAVLIAQRQRQLAALKPQPIAAPMIDPAYAAAAQQQGQPAPTHAAPSHAAQLPQPAPQQAAQVPYAQPPSAYDAAQSASPYGGAMQSASPYSEAPRPGSPYGAAQSASPHGGPAQPGSAYSGAPHPGSPYDTAQAHVQQPPPGYAHAQHPGSSGPSASAPSASVERDLRAAKRNPTLWIVLALLVIGAIVTAIVLAPR